MNGGCKVSDPFAVSGARVFDGEHTLVDHAVLVEGGMVSGVVPCDDLPKGTTRYHEAGCTVLPGLIDTHVHFMRWQGPLFLASGVTTVRDTGNDFEWILSRRNEWKEKRWPRILCMGPPLDGPTPGHEVLSRSCVDVADAVTAVGEVTDQGVDGVKFYEGLNPEWLAPMAEKAHATGCKVSMHCGGSVLAAAKAGVDEFFHLDGILADVWSDRPAGWLEIWGLQEFARTRDRQQEVADRIRASGITATPTLAYWDSQWRVRAADWLGLEEPRYTPSDMIKWLSIPPDPLASEQWRSALHAAQGFVEFLLERDVPVLAGSDVPFGLVPPGLSLWHELFLLTEAGMSPEQALRAATSDAATFCDRKELGRLSAGSVADMVVVKGNPLERIPARPEIAMTIHNGKVHRPEDLLAEAEQAGASLDDEPWAVQFEHHWQRRRASQTPG